MEEIKNVEAVEMTTEMVEEAVKTGFFTKIANRAVEFVAKNEKGLVIATTIASAAAMVYVTKKLDPIGKAKKLTSAIVSKFHKEAEATEPESPCVGPNDAAEIDD